MALRAIFFGAEDRVLVAQVQAVRKAIFVDHCGWQLHVEGGLESDEFDGPGAVHLALLKHGAVQGTFRAIRTDRRYLASNVFPALAVTRTYPARADAWEISRFGVLPGHRAADLGRITYALMFAFAQRVGASALVAVASLDHERFLRTLGIRTRRYGPPGEVGLDLTGRPLRAVAGEIVPALQDPARLEALLTLIEDLEIVDHANVFGPRLVSA